MTNIECPKCVAANDAYRDAVVAYNVAYATANVLYAATAAARDAHRRGEHKEAR